MTGTNTVAVSVTAFFSLLIFGAYPLKLSYPHPTEPLETYYSEHTTQYNEKQQAEGFEDDPFLQFITGNLQQTYQEGIPSLLLRPVTELGRVVNTSITFKFVRILEATRKPSDVMDWLPDVITGDDFMLSNQTWDFTFVNKTENSKRVASRSSQNTRAYSERGDDQYYSKAFSALVDELNFSVAIIAQATLPNGARIEVATAFFDQEDEIVTEAENLKDRSYSYQLDSQTLKFSYYVENWPFASNESSLWIVLDNVYSDPYHIDFFREFVLDQYRSRVQFRSDFYAINFSLQNFTITDDLLLEENGDSYFFNPYFEDYPEARDPQCFFCGIRLYFESLNFENYTYFDPDISLLVFDDGQVASTSASEDDRKGGGDNDHDLYLLFLITILLPVCVLCALCTVCTICAMVLCLAMASGGPTAFVGFKKLNRVQEDFMATSGHINWDYSEDKSQRKSSNSDEFDLSDTSSGSSLHTNSESSEYTDTSS